MCPNVLRTYFLPCIVDYVTEWLESLGSTLILSLDKGWISCVLPLSFVSIKYEATAG